MHANAAGCSIKNHDIPKFHVHANDVLKEMDFNEEYYEVNFICKSNDNIVDIVYALDEIEDTYGQKNEQPIIAVEDIRVNRKEIIIQGANSDSVKIQKDSMTYVLFKCLDFIEAINNLQSDFFKLTLIGKANLNKYYGSFTPQILVEQWEIKEESIFDF